MCGKHRGGRAFASRNVLAKIVNELARRWRRRPFWRAIDRYAAFEHRDVMAGYLRAKPDRRSRGFKRFKRRVASYRQTPSGRQKSRSLASRLRQSNPLDKMAIFYGGRVTPACLAASDSSVNPVGPRSSIG
jgi:hypothetical protein